MWIQVKLFGTLRRLAQPGTPGLWQGQVPEGCTLRELFLLLGTSENEVAAAAIDGKVCGYEESIPPGAVITLVTNVGGG
jgi:hypothetical protein